MKLLPFADMVFSPAEMAVLFQLMIVISGILIMVGLRKLALSLLGVTLVTMFMPAMDPIFDSIFTSLPDWLFWGLVVLFGLGLLRWLLESLLGKEAVSHGMGILIADAVKGILGAPFRLIGWLYGTGPVGRRLVLALLAVTGLVGARWYWQCCM